MGERPEAAPGTWARPEDAALYEAAVGRLATEDVVVQAYLGERYTTGLTEEVLTARFLAREVVGEVLASGRREFYDYQDAVEQRDRVARRRRRTGLSPARLGSRLYLWALDRQVLFTRRQWESALPAALSGQVRRLLRELLGDDHDTLLVTHDILGLIEVHDLRYVVPYLDRVSLVKRMELMAGGAIAISGPRGVGKSTLLRELAHREAAKDLVVRAEIPAAYVPQEFLLSLFQRVCEEFLALHGRAADSSFTFLIRLRKHLLRRLRAAASFWARLLLAVVLLSVALAPLATALSEALEGGLGGWLGRRWGDVSAGAVRVWAEHPWLVRVPLALLGLGLLATLSRRRKTSPLVQECVNYLYLLRTVQSTSVAATAGVAALSAGTFGLGRTSTLSTRTLNFPELVVHFRDLLERLARAERTAGRRIFVVIDEIDRLGAADQARSLLTEIKAVFGIPNVYFLISVAEDVGADFVRRGLPVRDVVDSYLDDVVHIGPRTLDESRAVLHHRAPGLALPFVALAHCLAGGITRDLIRYTRRIVMAPEGPGVTEWRLRGVAREVLSEELRETLAGFRVRLGGAVDSDRRLEELRSAVTLLGERHERGRAGLLPGAVERLLDVISTASSPSGAPPLTGGADSSDSAGSPEGAARTWEELGAYTDFVLTLLEFFTERETFPDQAAFTGAGYDGMLQRLAEARLELAVSPAGARQLLGRFRAAWNMPRAPHGAGG
ncbi:P-loop NTPase fold protein [Streptomyces lavendulocolor]|uniref:P-loop NTPase fold protein n=1 Tax=Streptomyces lavendulocolor TaxID=67316 RepID=A0ABV2W453_9ACTN